MYGAKILVIVGAPTVPLKVAAAWLFGGLRPAAMAGAPSGQLELSRRPNVKAWVPGIIRVPEGHITHIRILQTMVSGFPPCLDLRTSMWVPLVIAGGWEISPIEHLGLLTLILNYPTLQEPLSQAVATWNCGTKYLETVSP